MPYLYGQEENRVILISIDGLRPDFYLNNEWNTPHLKRFKSEGIYALGVRSVFPSVTYPAHTTIVTGAFPKEHGIFFNASPESKNNHWNWEADRIKTKTLWDAAQDRGITTAAIMWPVTVGAPITYNFPVRRADASENVGQLAITEPLVNPKILVSEMRQEGLLDSEHAFDHENIDQTIGNMGRYVLRKYKPALFAIHFLGADHIQHLEGKSGPHVKEIIENIDAEIGKIFQVVELENMINNTTIIITGDHGFIDVNKVFSPNVILRKLGLIAEDDWKAKFVCAGGSAFLYLKNQKYLPKIKKVLNEFRLKNKDVFRVITPAEYEKIGADPKAVLALALEPGYSASRGLKGPVLKERKQGGTHGYFPDFNEIETGFIIWGARVKQHKEIKIMGLEDITPIVSEILELGFAGKNDALLNDILN